MKDEPFTEYVERVSLPPGRILRWPALLDWTNSNRRSIADLIKKGQFPAPIPIGRIGGRSIGFLTDEVEAWINSRIELRNKQLRRRGIIRAETPPPQERD